MTTTATLQDALRSCGARWSNEMPDRAMHFGDPEKEYHAACQSAALFDFTRRVPLQLTGRDAAKFLNNFCTNKVKDLPVGQGCEAFITNVKGRVLNHVFIFADEDGIAIDAAEGTAESLVAHLDRYLITEDVEIRRLDDTLGMLLITGPEAADQLSRAGLADQPTEPFRQTRTETGDIAVTLRRIDLFDRPGYVILADRSHLGVIWLRLIDHGVQVAGDDVAEALRIEAGFPTYGRDISEENLAQEVGRTEQAICFTKGCYLGQEPIARLDALGHTNRELRGLRLLSGPIPEAGSPVWVADHPDPVGHVSSAAWSYEAGAPVALALLRQAACTPGTTVAVDVHETPTAAQVFWPTLRSVEAR